MERDFLPEAKTRGINRTLITNNIKFDFTIQANSAHSIKTGFSFINYDLQYSQDDVERICRNLPEGDNYKPIVLPDSTVYSDIYNVKSQRKFILYTR